MAENLEELVLRLSADVSGLKAGLDSATAETRKAVNTMQSTMTSLKGSMSTAKNAVLELAAALGVTLSIGAFKRFVEGSMEGIVQMARMADKLGIAQSQLYGLTAAAERAGVDVGGLSASILRMERAISMASTKTPLLQKGFKEIGLDAKALKDMRPDVAFGMISDGINKLGNQADKTRVAMEIFGRGGLQLMNVFAQGSKGIADMKKEMDDFGVTIDRTGGAKVQLASRAMKDLGHVVEGVGNQFAEQLAPYIWKAYESLMTFIKESGGIKQFVAPAVEFMIKVVGGFIDEWQMLVRVVEGLRVVWKSIEIGFDVMMAGLISGVVWWKDLFVKSWGVIVAAGNNTWASMQLGWYGFKWVAAEVIEWVVKKTGWMLVSLGESMTAVGVKGADMFRSAGLAMAGSVAGMAQSAATDLAKTQGKAIDAGAAMKQAWGELAETTTHGNTAGEEWLSAAEQNAQDLDALLLEIAQNAEKPWGTESIHAWAEEAKAEIQPVAEAMAKASGGAEDKAPQEDPRKAAAKAWFDEYKGMLNEKQIAENNTYNEDVAKAKEHFDTMGTDQATQDAVFEDMKAKHEGRLNNIETTQQQKTLNWEKQTQAEKLAFFGGVLGNLAKLSESKNRAMFQVGKAAALAEAVVNTASGATKAYSQYGYPWGLVAAAAIIAAGAVNIATISGTSFGGGGSVSGGGGGATAAIPMTESAANPTSASVPNITLSVPDDAILDARGVRKLISLINQARQDGVVMA